MKKPTELQQVLELIMAFTDRDFSPEVSHKIKAILNLALLDMTQSYIVKFCELHNICQYCGKPLTKKHSC